MDLFTLTVNAADVRLLRAERRHGILPDPLYVQGDLSGLAAPTVAIVGTRAPSKLGRDTAYRLALELGRAGIAIISGLARGIDAAAHTGAVAAGAPSIGVLAGGHDRFYPPEHRGLADEMIRRGGAVISPFEPGAIPFAGRFLARNGVIAALADAVIVVEAPARSGALNTASWAADAGIPVLVVPGDADRPKVAGCLALIRDGATLIRHSADVLEALGLEQACKKKSPLVPSAVPLPLYITSEHASGAVAPDASAGKILRVLSDGPAGLDTLAAATGLPVSELLRQTALLALEERIVQLDDGSYAMNALGAASR